MNMSPTLSLQRNPVADYLRKRPNSLATRCLSLPLRTWRNLNTDSAVTPYTKFVPLDRLLCGGEQGLSAAQYARHTGNYLRPSTPISRSPHVLFLQQYQQVGDKIFCPDVFRQTAYFKYALEGIGSVGEYLGCTTEEQVEQIARQFVALFRDELSENGAGRASHFRAPGSVVYVRPIQYSDCYEVRDGMHQLAIAHVRGERTYKVYVVPPPVVTPVQQLILDHVFTRGDSKEYYQPIDAPELGDQWKLIRRCTDRFGMMKQFLEERGLMPPKCATSLDIACSYGWFVRSFSQLGFDAYGGGEMDWAACEIGKRVYGLREDQVTRSEVVRFLQDNSRRYDVVSCLSLLHHFVIGAPYRASISAEEMLRLVDRATKTVLFFDMGQSHEAWFRDRLAGWDADYIEQWLRKNSSFTKIYRLGTDHDNIPPFEDNYGRTLFACMR